MNTKTIGIALCTAILLINWASQPEKNGAQFFGTLVTHQDNTFRINNITIGYDKKTAAIPIYEKPQKPSAFTILNDTHISLNIDPTKDLAIINLDLDKVAHMSIPHPLVVWTYKKEKGSREHFYVEIAITTKSNPVLDAPNLTTSYLIEQDIQLQCDRIDNAQPEKMSVKLPAIKTLSIEGYTFVRDKPTSSIEIIQQNNHINGTTNGARTIAHTTDSLSNHKIKHKKNKPTTKKI